MAKSSNFSIDWVKTELAAKSYLKSRVSTLSLSSDEKETAIFRAAIYALIDDGLETKHSSFDGFTFSSRSVDLTTFEASLNSRCEQPGGTQTGQGFLKFNFKAPAVLDRLQLLNFVELTEDLVNNSSSILLKIESLLPPSEDKAAPASKKKREKEEEEEEEDYEGDDWEDESGTPMSEDEDEDDEEEYNTEADNAAYPTPYAPPNMNNNNDALLPEDPLLPSIHFTVPSVSFSDARAVKHKVNGSIRAGTKGFYNKRISMEAARLIFDLGFSCKPGKNFSTHGEAANAVYTQRPVALRTVFKMVAAKVAPEKGTPEWDKLRIKQQQRLLKKKKKNLVGAVTDYNKFKMDVIWRLKAKKFVLVDKDNFHSGKNEICLANMHFLLPHMQVLGSSPSNAAGGSGGGTGALAASVGDGAALAAAVAAVKVAAPAPAPAPAAREKPNVEAPNAKKMAVDNGNNTRTYFQYGANGAMNTAANPAAFRKPPTPSYPLPLRFSGLYPPHPSTLPGAAGAGSPAAGAPAAAAAPKPPPPSLPPPATSSDATTWSGPTIINTLRAANQAMLEIDKQLKNGFGVIGTPSDIRSPLSSRVDLLNICSSSGVVWMFDFKSTSQPESREIWKLLKTHVFEPPPRPLPATATAASSSEYLAAAAVQGGVVLHDCRWLGPALYRQGGIRLQHVFDVQVAHGVLQVVKGIGGSGGLALPRTLRNIFEDYKFPPNPKTNMGLHANHQIFQRRTLPQTVQEFFAHDTFDLYKLGKILKADLGSEGTSSVVRMSRAYGESHFIENHKSYKITSSGSSYAGAAGGGGGGRPVFDSKKLPHGIPLEVTFDEEDHYAASYVIAPRDMANITGGKKAGIGIGGGSSAAQAAGGEGPSNGNNTTIANGTAAANTANTSLSPNANGHTITNTNNNNNHTSNSKNNTDPAENRDVATILSLFPKEITDAVLSLCNTNYKATDDDIEDMQEEEEDDEEEGEYNPRYVSTAGAAAAAQTPATTPVIKWPIEILVDIGRPVSIRFSDGTEALLDESIKFSVEDALKLLVNARTRLGIGSDGGAGGSSSGGLNFTAGANALGALDVAGGENPYGNKVHLSDIFSSDNRAGIPGTLHRISAIRGRKHEVLGLTYRIGRHLEGIGDLVHDVLARVSCGTGNLSTSNGSDFPFSNLNTTTSGIAGAIASSAATTNTPSLLLLGPPGVGKSTLLRDVARILANTFSKRVVVVDTSNEIAGEGSIAHPCIGKARRMMVPHRDRQHEVMKEAVQNHNPDVVIIDEIGDHYEVAAAKTIAQRGVVLVGTAHGTSLETLMKNPELNPLVGGIQAVILGDQAVRQSQSTKKTQLERKGAPCFTTLIELLAPSKWRIHKDVAKSVDCLLNGKKPETELRWIAPDGRYLAQFEGGVPHAMDVGGLKAAQLTMQVLTAQAAGVDGGERVAWIADLALLASRYS